MSTAVNELELENRVKEIYRDATDAPDEEFHFETGRGLAERLGHSPIELDRIKQDADLWTVRTGGAVQIDDYTNVIETPGFSAVDVGENPRYEFLSKQAQGARRSYGVKSISLRARDR